MSPWRPERFCQEVLMEGLDSAIMVRVASQAWGAAARAGDTPGPQAPDARSPMGCPRVVLLYFPLWQRPGVSCSPPYLTPQERASAPRSMSPGRWRRREPHRWTCPAARGCLQHCWHARVPRRVGLVLRGTIT